MKIDQLKQEQVKGFETDIEKATLENDSFRKVLYTSKYSQLVLMSLNPQEEIGEEVHPDIDQFLRFEAGNGIVKVNGTEYRVKDGDAVIVPAGARHNVMNTGSGEDLKMYTIYSPPHHKDGTVHKTRQDAEADEKEFNGVTSEGI